MKIALDPLVHADLSMPELPLWLPSWASII